MPLYLEGYCAWYDIERKVLLGQYEVVLMILVAEQTDDIILIHIENSSID